MDFFGIFLGRCYDEYGKIIIHLILKGATVEMTMSVASGFIKEVAVN